MIVAGGLALYVAAFWVPTMLPRFPGLVIAMALLAGSIALIVSSAQRVPSRTHFDIAREAGAATGVFMAVAPLAAILFLARVPQAERRTGMRVAYLLPALCLSAVAGYLTFSLAFPRI